EAAPADAGRGRAAGEQPQPRGTPALALEQARSAGIEGARPAILISHESRGSWEPGLFRAGMGGLIIIADRQRTDGDPVGRSAYRSRAEEWVRSGLAAERRV